METENNMQEQIGNESREMATLIIESKENARNQKHNKECFRWAHP